MLGIFREQCGGQGADAVTKRYTLSLVSKTKICTCSKSHFLNLVFKALYNLVTISTLSSSTILFNTVDLP